MADDSQTKRKPRIIKKPKETVRQRAEKASTETARKPRRIRATAGKVAAPVKRASTAGKREFNIPLPDNKIGRFFNKRVHFIPRYFREAYGELRQVTWPSRTETWKLTGAVFVFAIFFSLLIAVTDYGLSTVFRKIFLQ